MNKNSIIRIVAFAACAIVMLGVGIMKYQNSKVFLPATATITAIEEEYTGTTEDGYEHIVYISFKADGNKYETKLDSYDASMKIGDRVDIIYNPEKPTEVQTAGAMSYIIFFVIGALSAVGTVVCIVKPTGKNTAE